jgi:uncharacterized surface protein with fasciclin (FAS1) repeats
MKTTENVYQAIKRDERFTILSKILDITGIGEAMSGERDAFTFFAPTDNAFHRLSESALILLLSPEGAGLVAAILSQHLVPRTYLYSTDLRRRDSVKTMHGNKLNIREEANILQIEEANILMPVIAASNAVVFPIDKVLPARRGSLTAAGSQTSV